MQGDRPKRPGQIQRLGHLVYIVFGDGGVDLIGQANITEMHHALNSPVKRAFPTKYVVGLGIGAI